MLTVNELRIGNIIRCNDYSPMPKREFVCQEILTDSVTIKGMKFLLIYIEPVPITERCLFNLGFEYSHRLGSRSFFSIGNLYVEIGADRCSVYYTNKAELICFINFVHELQNLFFSLTREELTFKES